MNKNSFIDYSGYILLKVLGPVLRALPLPFALFLGRRLGSLFFFLDYKHRAVAYSNLKTAFGANKQPCELIKITKEFYRTFGQNLIEILLIPKIDKQYFNKYITVEGAGNITEAQAKSKGVILLSVHAGGWELGSLICANLGIDFYLFVRSQRYPHLNRLLNSFRLQKGCKIIERESLQLRKLVGILKNNQVIVMTADQGGRSGTLVKFFAKTASMASGAVRLALKYDCAILPSFSTRLNGPYIKVIIDPPLRIKKTGDLEKDIKDNLENIAGIFERHISLYPKDYLWTYKIWKYSKEKSILILSDSKAGHLRQSQAAAGIMESILKEKGSSAKIDTTEIRFKNKFNQHALTLSSCLGGRYQCQGCLWCLSAFLEKDSFRSLLNFKPDVVISCGSSLAPVNFLIARENLAKSVVIMRPSILGARKFDLVIAPEHDRLRRRKNIISTQGALNLVDEEYLRLQAASLKPHLKIEKDLVLGLLLGGDTRNFRLSADLSKTIFSQIKNSLEMHDGEILITTSRRTSGEVERLIKEEFANYARCKFLVIANENNPAGALGAILALSNTVIISPESISMISEAVSSKKYVIVFNSGGLSSKHRRFLNNFSKNKYIYLTEPGQIGGIIKDLYANRPQVRNPEDRFLVAEALKKLI